MQTYKIVTLPGDGIGPEILSAALNVLDAAGAKFNLKFEYSEQLIGHAAIEATGTALPDATLDACADADAVLLAAVGHPKYDNDPAAQVRPEQGLLKIRKSLGLFANLRPIKIFEELADSSSLKREIISGADILFFRELTGGIYFGEPRGRKDNNTVAFDTKIYSKPEVERIGRKAFEAAMRRGKKICSVDKANVLESSRLWRETIQALTPQYPEVAVTHMFIDNAAMQLIRNPKQFDVVVTGNMFGDILTDEASQISGSLGLLPSASVGSRIGLFEPVHGSAPDIAGQNLANPLAMVLSTALMLSEGLQQNQCANAIIAAVDAFLKQGYRTADIANPQTPSNKILGTKEAGAQLQTFLNQ